MPSRRSRSGCSANETLAELDSQRDRRLEVIAAIREAIVEWQDKLAAAQARWDANADEIESLNS